MIATSCRTATVPGPAVEAVELLGLHIGTTLAARAQLEQMQTLAYRDQLTGVANRTLFERTLAEHDSANQPSVALAPTRRSSDHASAVGPFARRTGTWLALFDVDRFKQINDRLGHAGGDDALRAIAQILTDNVRDRDEVFRLGGDEFAVLFSGVDEDTARDTVARLAERCATTLAPLGAGLSAGLAELSEQCTAAKSLAEADRELYRCKVAGGLTAMTAPLPDLLETRLLALSERR
jgi:diguanylate cyclase (GGDEF)-like protein